MQTSANFNEITFVSQNATHEENFCFIDLVPMVSKKNVCVKLVVSSEVNNLFSVQRQ
jgi:hypothetical protein